MRSAGLIAALLLCPAFAAAQPADVPKARAPSLASFSSLCIVEESTGFSWESGAWVRSSYAPRRFVVRKYPIDYVASRKIAGYKFGGCSADEREPAAPFESDASYFSTQGCYSVKLFGSSPDEEIATLCSEFWAKANTGGWAVSSIHCSLSTRFTFRPDGPFINQSLIADLASPSELIERARRLGKVGPPIPKDSIYVEHGSCSQVTTGVEE
jgi:hypothetical protein